MRNRTNAIGSATGANACSRVSATRRFIATARHGERSVSCPAAMLAASFALTELGKGTAFTRRRIREGGRGCALAVAKAAGEVSQLVIEACGGAAVESVDQPGEAEE